MPYEIRRAGDKYAVVNVKTGRVHARHTSRAKAQRQLNVLHAVEHSSWRPTGRKARDLRG